MPRFLSAIFASMLLLSACVPAQKDIPPAVQPPAPVEAAQSGSTKLPLPVMEVVVERAGARSSVASGTGSMVERIADNGVLEIGIADAPLVLTVFTNTSCEYCTEFIYEQLPRLEKEYVDEGLLRVRIVLVSLKKYPNSNLEASALLCAAALGKGKLMHAALIDASLRNRKAVIALAQKLKLQAQSFAACLDSKETKNLLNQQVSFINDQGVTLLPTFTLGDERIVGLPSYADLRGWVEAQR